MKTNTKLIETKTYVNHDKRSVTVVQKYELDVFAIKNFVGLAIACVDIGDYVKDSIVPVGKFDFKDNKLILTVSGKSRCMPNDKFDEKLGFRIADTRAQAKAMKIFTSFYKDIVNLVYTNLLEDVEDKFNNCSNAYWACKEHELRLISNC